MDVARADGDAERAGAGAGLLTGGAVGFLMLPEATPSIAGIPSPYIGLGGGAIIGLMGGIALLRFAIAIATGLAFGVAGLLICATYLHFSVGLSTPRPIGPAPVTSSD